LVLASATKLPLGRHLLSSVYTSVGTSSDKEMLLKLFQEALKGHYLRQVELIAEAIELDAQ